MSKADCDVAGGEFTWPIEFLMAIAEESKLCLRLLEIQRLYIFDYLLGDLSACD